MSERENPEQSDSELVLDGRLLVKITHHRGRPAVSIGSRENLSGSMMLTPLELAALLDGPLQRALARVNGE